MEWKGSLILPLHPKKIHHLLSFCFVLLRNQVVLACLADTTFINSHGFLFPRIFAIHKWYKCYWHKDSTWDDLYYQSPNETKNMEFRLLPFKPMEPLLLNSRAVQSKSQWLHQMKLYQNSHNYFQWHHQGHWRTPQGKGTFVAFSRKALTPPPKHTHTHNGAFWVCVMASIMPVQIWETLCQA